MLRIVVLFALVIATSALLGFDLSVKSTEEDWSCLASPDIGGSFGIIRLYRNIGQVDRNSSKSILAANTVMEVGRIDGYMFPCISQSQYSIDHNITCDSAATQVLHTLQYLAEEGIAVKGSSLQPGPYFPDLVTLNRIWIDIEDEVPSKYYSANTADNIAFLADITTSLQGYGIEMGIYTTKTYWSNVMNNVLGYGLTNKLWYPHYDGVNNMDFAADVLPFADFTSVYIKQTNGNVGDCSISQVDSNYMPDLE